MNATQKEIEEAANAAGAHEFIIDLPDVSFLHIECNLSTRSSF